METGREVIKRMNNPTEWMTGEIFSCQINFFRPENPMFECEASFVVDCTQPDWRDTLLALWERYRLKHGLPEFCVSDAWATVLD